MTDNQVDDPEPANARRAFQDLINWISTPAVCVDAEDTSVCVLNSAAREFFLGELGHDPSSLEEGRFWPADFPFHDLEGGLDEGRWDNGGVFNFRRGDGVSHPLELGVEKVARGDRAAYLFRLRIGGAGRRGTAHLNEIIRRLDRAQALSRTGCWEWNILTNALAWSDEIYRIFGLEPSAFDASYPAFLERVHPEDRALVEEAVRRAVEEGAAYDIDHRIVRPDGEVRHVHERGEIDYTADGRPARMLGAVQDVTEMRRIERAATRNRDMLSGLFRISPEAIIVANAQGHIVVFSAGAEAVFGYRAHEVVGQSVELLMPERFRHGHGAHVDRFLAGAVESLQMAQRRPIYGLRKTGEEIPIEASLSRIRTGGEVLLTTIVRDLSERYETEAHLIEARNQAQDANRAKSAFLANMSHELRTPLNGVLGVAGALSRSIIDPLQKEMVDLIEASGRALQDLLTDILDLAQVEAGRLEISKEPFDLGALVRTASTLFSESARDKGVVFDLVLPDESSGRFHGDEKRIRQVLNNLLSNAVKFTDRGRITLAVTAPLQRADGCWVRFGVQDSGIGFGEEMKARLFNRFEQADSSVTRRFGGTGLGLSICKVLVELMGGTIEAQSTPGRGATFTFELPLTPVAADSGVGSDPESAPEPEAGGRAPRILLAEDHPTNRRVVELILDPLEVCMTSVENGRQAVEAAAAETFDLILMDMQMPVMDGVEAVRQIRERERAEGRPRTPICMLTADALPQHRTLSYEAGADDFLTKPLVAADLIGRVIDAVEKSADLAA